MMAPLAPSSTRRGVLGLCVAAATGAVVWQQAFISGIGAKVGQSGLGLIKGFPYTAAYEDLTFEGKA